MPPGTRNSDRCSAVSSTILPQSISQALSWTSRCGTAIGGYAQHGQTFLSLVLYSPTLCADSSISGSSNSHSSHRGTALLYSICPHIFVFQPSHGDAVLFCQTAVLPSLTLRTVNCLGRVVLPFAD